MIIRETQIKALEQVVVDNYIVELSDHCKEFSPHLSKTLNDEQLHSAIRKGIDWAAAYGFTQRGPVRFYIDMMIVLGSGFDTDPQYPWTAEILADPEEPGQMERADALHAKLSSYLEKVDGEKNAYTLKALEDLSARLKQGIEFQHANFEQDTLHLMKEIHPRKVAETGDEPVLALITDAKTKARKSYRFEEARGFGLMAVLMFAFGHLCDADPLLPWISRTLNQTGEVPPEKIAEDLERRAVTWLDAVLRNAKEGK